VASVEHQQAGGAIEGEPERRQLGRSSDLVVVADGGQDVRFGDRPIDAALVGSEVERWAQLQFDRAGAGQQLIGEVDGVLAVGQDDALLDLVSLGVVAPDREAELQAELGEVRDAGEAGAPSAGSLPPSSITRSSGRRSCSERWLSMTIRPSGAGRAATSMPWKRRVATPATVPEAEPPRPFVTSHSRVSSASASSGC